MLARRVAHQTTLVTCSSSSYTAGLVVGSRRLTGRRHAAVHAAQQLAGAACSPVSSALLHWRQQAFACRAGRSGSATAAAAAAGTAVSSSSSSASTTAAVPGSSPKWPTAPPECQHLTYLQELRLRDFALVPAAAVAFSPGLVVISGQSGAGKSVLLDALGQLMGAAAAQDCVRPPAEMAVVEGAWWCGPDAAAAAGALLREMGLPARALPEWEGSSSSSSSGGVIHIRREISRMPAAAGTPATRSRVLINGVASSLRVLRALGALLADVNGQHASLALRDSATQLQLLDRIAGTTALAASLSAQQSRLATLEAQLAQAEALGDDAERAALQKRVELINRAGITAGEEVSLRRRLSALESRRGCLEAAAAVQAGIQGDGTSGGGAGGPPSLSDALRLVMGQLRGVLASEEQQLRLLQQQRRKRRQRQQQRPGSPGSGRDGAAAAADSRHADELALAGDEAEYEEGDDEGADGGDDDVEAAAEAASSSAGVSALSAALEELEAAQEALGEAQAQLSSYASAADYSPSEAAELSARLELLERLCRRFRARGTSQLLQLAELWSDQLEQYYASIGQAEAWRAEAATLQADISQAALALSQGRQAAAGALSDAVQGCLSQLAMGSSRFAVDISWTPAGQAEQQAGPSSRAVLVPTSAQPHPLLAATDSSVATGSISSSSSIVEAQAGRSSLFRLSPTGLDSVTFLLSAGPAEPLRTLAATASGGEAARIMLALKAAPAAAATLAQQQGQQPAAHSSAKCSSSTSSVPANGAGSVGLVSVGPPVLVMDELDAGLGSRLGEPVGRLLAGLVGAGGQPRAACQVLMVTHTPQVAAHANTHIQVHKQASEDGRVITCFKQLASTADRQAELADMLGLGAAEGAPLAAEMLAAAHGAAAHSAAAVADVAAVHADGVPAAAAGVSREASGFSSCSVSDGERVGGGDAAVGAAVAVGSITEAHQELQGLHSNSMCATVTCSSSSGSSNGSSSSSSDGSSEQQDAGTQHGAGAAAEGQSSSGSESGRDAASSSRWLLGLSAAAAAAGVAAANADHRSAAAQHGLHASKQDGQ